MKHGGDATDAAGWNRQYETAGYNWTAANPWVYSEMNGARPGKALDLGAGDGRHTVWLAERGWQVESVDYAIIGLEIGQRRAAAKRVENRITWTVADITTYSPVPGTMDLVLATYLNLHETQLKKVIATAAGALSPGGRMLFINHDTANLTDGIGGPDDISVLHSPKQVAQWMSQAGLQIDSAGIRSRPVPGERRTALDCVVLGAAPYSTALPVPTVNSAPSATGPSLTHPAIPSKDQP